MTAGSGLTGGGTTGNVTLSLNTTFTDARYLLLSGGALTGGLSAPSFTGNGAGLTNLNPLSLSPGTAGINITRNAATAALAGAAISATTATNAAELGGVASDDYARLDIGNTFTGNQTVAGDVSVSGNSATKGDVTIGSGGTPIAKHLSMTFNPSFPTLRLGTVCTSLSFSSPGASDGDTVALGVPNARMTGNFIYTAWVSAANTITIRACTLDLFAARTTFGTGLIRVDIWKH